ncbi:hypothetical protein [Streptomyces sp. NBC_01353]|uniref:hypothetical protein n=1 Tax=Streptomyces sp. NBC_01353 TaxID=2903835 RepID=UPI002E368AB7|nr:hypothetical protein [Streptomyces sp. NBC_01353]
MSQERPRQQPSGAPPARWRRKPAALAMAGLGIVVTAALTYWATQGVEKATRAVGNTLGLTVRTPGPTIHIDVEQGFGHHDAYTCDGSGWVFPWDPDSKAANTPPGQGERRGGKTWDEDPAAFGGVPAGPLDLVITVSGESEKAIVLKDLTFHVEERRPPLAGIVIPDWQCAAQFSYRSAEVRLNARPPQWQPAAASEEGERSEPLRFPYTVTAADPEVLVVRVDPAGCHCTWWAELAWVSGSESGRAAIKEDGRPFQTTSVTGLPAFSWLGSKRESF